jgi:hypothetical protein
MDRDGGSGLTPPFSSANFLAAAAAFNLRDTAVSPTGAGEGGAFVPCVTGIPGAERVGGACKTRLPSKPRPDGSVEDLLNAFLRSKLSGDRAGGDRG